MSGFHNNVNFIESNIKSGSIKLTRDSDTYTFAGNTYKVKDFLKSEYGARWDRDAKAWTVEGPRETIANQFEEWMAL